METSVRMSKVAIDLQKGRFIMDMIINVPTFGYRTV